MTESISGIKKPIFIFDFPSLIPSQKVQAQLKKSLNAVLFLSKNQGLFSENKTSSFKYLR